MNKAFTYFAVSALTAAMAIPAFAEENHPELEKAIHALEDSKHDLEKANHDFGGHRVEAIKHVDGALKELHEALEFAKTHPDKK